MPNERVRNLRKADRLLVENTPLAEVMRSLGVSHQTYQCSATNAARRITAAGTMAVLDQIVEERGYAPRFLRMDNGPEFIADSLQDWCRATNVNTSYCGPGSPWQNERIESFNSRRRDELLTLEIFDSMWEIRFLLEEHRKNYNHF